MNKEEIYKSIAEWEENVGESFVDYFNSDIHALTYMSWCLGKGYLSCDKYNEWARAYRENKLEANDPNYFIYNEYEDEDALFAVVVSEEWNEVDQKRAYMYLSEFISEIEVYQKRFKDFLES